MNLVIIQARMGSSRLPGKVLKEINGKSLLEIQQTRIRPSTLVDKIIIATTINTEDDAIEEFCLNKKVDFYRGSDWDVLDRYYQAAKPFSPLNVIRVTSDCPLHHYKVIDFVIDEFLKSGKDYFSNSNNEPDYLEDGFDVEVFTFKALETAWHEAKLLSEREHVTPFIKNSGMFSCGWKKYSASYQQKLSVDSQEDFNAVEQIFKTFSPNLNFEMEDILQLLEKKPEILSLNKNSIINSGYIKSLNNDKEVK